jgi:hypothetical protein
MSITNLNTDGARAIYLALLGGGDPRLGPYNYKYPSVVVTGSFPVTAPRIQNIDDLKTYWFGGHTGLPRVSSTPLGVNSLYNRAPYIDQGSLQTRGI